MIDGKWHAMGSAASINATFSTTTTGDYLLEIENGVTYKGVVSTLHVGNRLGNTPRNITFEDGSIFTTRDNDFIDKTFKRYLLTNTFIHTLETKLLWVFVALLITGLSTFSFFKWGVLCGSSKVAHSLRHETNELIFVNTLDFLDTYMFDETNITQKRQETIRKHFNEKLLPLSPLDQSIAHKIHFRM